MFIYAIPFVIDVSISFFMKKMSCKWIWNKLTIFCYWLYCYNGDFLAVQKYYFFTIDGTVQAKNPFHH